MQVQISLLQSDIDTGIPDSCLGCPIALAVERAFGLNPLRGEHAEVTRLTIDLRIGLKRIVVAETPDSASQFVYAFDDRMPVAPFAFPLTVPDDTHDRLRAAREAIIS